MAGQIQAQQLVDLLSNCLFNVEDSLAPFVEPAFTLEVKKAQIHGVLSIAEKPEGLFVSDDVKRGDVIFKIKNPPLVAVGDGEDEVRNCCDNCFAGTEVFPPA